jgi:hypothetical protein
VTRLRYLLVALSWAACLVHAAPAGAMTAQHYRAELRAVTVPMMPGTVVRPPTPQMLVAIAADPATGTIYATGPMDAYTEAHERAHLLERVMTDADRQRFMLIMGSRHAWQVGQSPAYGDSDVTAGYRYSASEHFADWAAFVTIRHDPQGNHVIAGYLDRMPTRAQLLRFARALERFGDRRGLPAYRRAS